MKELDEKLIVVCGYLFTLGMAICLFITFYMAYFNGGTIIVNINYFGEAEIEFIVSFFIIVIMIIGFYYSIKLWRKNGNK